jgi:hypothetical protein
MPSPADTAVRAMAPVSGGRRIGYAWIDALVFCGLWIVVTETSNAKVPFGFMTSYTPQEYWNYVLVVGVMSAILLAASVANHALYGASLGKFLTGCRTVRANGSPLGWSKALQRAGTCWGIALAVLAPGPLAALFGGAGSEQLSLLLLAAGLGLWIFLMWPIPYGPNRGLTNHERLLGIQTVRMSSGSATLS